MVANLQFFLKRREIEAEKEQMTSVQPHHQRELEFIQTLRTKSAANTKVIYSILDNKAEGYPDTLRHFLIEEAKFHLMNQRLYSNVELLFKADSTFLTTYGN